jgi:hypothetical protein
MARSGEKERRVIACTRECIPSFTAVKDRAVFLWRHDRKNSDKSSFYWTESFNLLNSHRSGLAIVFPSTRCINEILLT